MVAILCVAVACLFAGAIYLLTSRRIIRMLLGAVLLSNAVNLLILTAGRIGPSAPPIIPGNLTVPEGLIANPLPQALILTAIVISFSFFAFLLVLTYRSYEDLNTDNTDEMRLAEPKDQGLPPLGY